MTPIVRSAHISCKAPSGSAATTALARSPFANSASAEHAHQAGARIRRCAQLHGTTAQPPQRAGPAHALRGRQRSRSEAEDARRRPRSTRRMACVKSFGRAVHPPTEACGRVPQSTGSRRRLNPCIRPSEPLLNCRRDWFLVGGSESSDGRKLPAVTEAVTFSRLRKIPGWKGQPEDIRWRPRPPSAFQAKPSRSRLGFVVLGLD